MVFLFIFCLPWIQLVSGEGGFKQAEEIMSKIYLENYPIQTLFAKECTANLWSLVQPMKNGNFISLLVFGSSQLIVFFLILKDFSKKKLL